MWGALAKEMLPWLPSLLTLAGWFLVNHQNNTRERRKDARSAADKCKALAREAAQLGIDYWGGGDQVAWKVKAALEELEVEIRRFPAHKGREQLTDALADFVDAVATGDDFDTTHRAPKPPDGLVMRDLARTRQAFLHVVEAQFEKYFH